MMRADFSAIAQWIKPGTEVLDVGCGDGALLAHLRDVRLAHTYGVELADDKVWLVLKKALTSYSKI